MLISYHYAKTLDFDALLRRFATVPKLFADSGAFSASTLGTRIDLVEYAEWVKANAKHFTVVANLDDIGNAEGSYLNLRRLERLGVNPIPVFHTGEDWSYFDRYCAEYPYIALGGAVGFPASKLLPWCIACFKRARALKSPAVFHGFGQTSLPAIMGLPWYSCDSSSWGMGYRFGRLGLFDPRQGRMIAGTLFDARAIRNLGPLIRLYGGDPDVFMDRKRYHASHAAAIAARAWRALETWLRRRHGPVAMPGHAEGLHLYLAASGGDINGSRGAAVNHALSGDDDLTTVVKRTNAAPGLHVYLADSNVGHHETANRALTAEDPGLHLYLADGALGMNRHRDANEALTGETACAPLPAS
jgi:hypothetical protein